MALMESFYLNLKFGASEDEALRQAQITLPALLVFPGSVLLGGRRADRRLAVDLGRPPSLARSANAQCISTIHGSWACFYPSDAADV